MTGYRGNSKVKFFLLSASESLSACGKKTAGSGSRRKNGRSGKAKQPCHPASSLSRFMPRRGLAASAARGSRKADPCYHFGSSGGLCRRVRHRQGRERNPCPFPCHPRRGDGADSPRYRNIDLPTRPAAMAARIALHNPQAQIAILTPSSTTRSVGIWKNSVAGTALRAITRNSQSRQNGIFGTVPETRSSRPTK